MKQVLIVGAGGIGSWLAHQIDLLSKEKQFEDVNFTIADNDIVEEKNLKYQNFILTDLTDYKAESISLKYNFNPITKRIENEDELKGYDCIVSAVDNSIFRKLLFNFVFKPENNSIYWIDLRSEGRSVAFFTKHPDNTYEKIMKTLPEEDKAEGSCQLEWELENNIIQNGNKIIAAIGAQLLLNWYRNEINIPSLIVRF